MMDLSFNDMLRSADLNPEKVIVFRHRPRERSFRQVLPWLAAERQDLFNAYQQTQNNLNVERSVGSLAGKGHVASFIGQAPGHATFVGLFRVAGRRPLTRTQFLSLPVQQKLHQLAPEAKQWFTPALEKTRPTVQFFDLQLTDFYVHWAGRLVINWPPPERSWWRRAHRNALTIHAVHEKSVFDAAMPPWQEITLTWDELRMLPKHWKAAMSEWRGIYYIYDISSGKGYVGSAYGNDNLMGRWQQYSASGHGGNKLLLKRDPTNFRFSILERVSPDMEASDVVALETSWKRRLHSHAPHGLNDN